MDYWRMQPEEIFSSLGSSKDGLSSREAKERLQKYGMNEIEPPDRKSLLRIFISQFQNPLFYILFAATILAYLMGDHTEALIILIMVTVNGGMGFMQEYRSEKALEELRKYVSMTAHVLRDGQAAEMNTKFLVPGDIILVAIGDIIPADARLMEAHMLETNESVLTGESNPVEKEAIPLNKEKPPPQDMHNTLFMGSTITAGSGKAIVVLTGKETYFGKSASALKAPAPQTDFEKSIRDFGSMLVKVIIAMTIFIFLVNSLVHQNILESLLFALAIAVGITPELLPIIITIGLSHGAMRMVQKQVIVKRLESIEDLGNIDILCADKTGTLTENQVSLIRYLDCMGKDNEDILLYSLLCNSAVVQHGKVKGGTIDSAIWTYALKKFDLGRMKRYSLVELIAFDYERKRMSAVQQGKEGLFLITKGAPESILPICSKILVSGKELKIAPYTKNLEKMVEDFGAQGYRVISVAYKEIGKRKGYSPEDEKDMVFMGLLILLDPPKKDTLPALEHFKHLGVEMYVLTGDEPLVTAEVCRQVGVQMKGGRIIAGTELDAMSEEEFRKIVESHNIYARLVPAQKLAIVKALKENGHVVGFIGDGVNDAPSLKASDVGISVKNGADIAKEAADVVLLRKSLNVIAGGISEGRKTFANIIKYIRNTISANFGNMFTLALASPFLPFIPLLPSQIILNNFISDIPMLAVSTDSVDKESLRRPRHWDINGITKFMVSFGLISSIFDFITMAFLLIVLGAGAALFRTIWFVESAISEILVVFAIRTRKPMYKSMPSRLLIIMSLLSVLFAVGITFSPLATEFEFVSLTLPMIGIIFAIVIIYVLIVEIAKHIYFSRNPE